MSTRAATPNAEILIDLALDAAAEAVEFAEGVDDNGISLEAAFAAAVHILRAIISSEAPDAERLLREELDNS
jgi:hypothetical protein